MTKKKDKPPVPTGKTIEIPPVTFPDALDAEQALLGALIMNNSNSKALPRAFSSEQFDEELHKVIYQAVIDMADEGKRADPVTLRHNIPAELAARPIGDMNVSQYLAALVGSAVSSVNIPDYAEAILTTYTRRGMGALGMDLLDLMMKTGNRAEVVGAMLECIERLEVMVDTLADQQERNPGRAYIDSYISKTKVAGIQIAFDEIAKVLNQTHFEPGNLYGILAGSGEGKTCLIMQMIRFSLTKGHPVMMLSYDQSREQCARQMVAQTHGISLDKQAGKVPMTDEEAQKCLNFATWLAEQPFEVVECSDQGAKQLAIEMKNFAKRYANNPLPPLFVVDHIRRIKPVDARVDAGAISTAITGVMKASMRKTNGVCIMVNQRNSSGAIRDNPKPTALDLWGGEAARQDYDAILYLYRPEIYRDQKLKIAVPKDYAKIQAVFGGKEITNMGEIGLIKNRFGDPRRTGKLEFEPEYTRYRSVAADSAPSAMSDEEIADLVGYRR
jgi:replicative DNA helicase